VSAHTAEGAILFTFLGLFFVFLCPAIKLLAFISGLISFPLLGRTLKNISSRPGRQ